MARHGLSLAGRAHLREMAVAERGARRGEDGERAA